MTDVVTTPHARKNYPYMNRAVTGPWKGLQWLNQYRLERFCLKATPNALNTVHYTGPRYVPAISVANTVYPVECIEYKIVIRLSPSTCSQAGYPDLVRETGTPLARSKRGMRE